MGSALIGDLQRRLAALVERHFDDLSAEVIRRHTRYLPEHGDYKARRSAKATLSRQRGAN